MTDDAASPMEIRPLLWRAGGGVVALFWLVQLVELSLTSFVEGTQRALALLAPRILIVVAGMALSVPVIEVAALETGKTFSRRLLATVFTALAMCIALMTVDYFVYFISFPAGRLAFDAAEFVYSCFGWSWFFLGLAGAVVALSYSVEMRDRERRLAALSAEARDARLAALRYQLNPHFLFNTLNSIAALIDSGERQSAESMVVNQAEFLRATLEPDRVIDIRLSREIEPQALYPSIEQMRFPARLRTRYDIDDAVAGALVPALISQPIVENAVRHAVARSSEPVTITIAASGVNGRLCLSIADNDRAKGNAAPGIGVGMANVRARLENRFGRAHSLDVVRDAAGFRVATDLPLAVRRLTAMLAALPDTLVVASLTDAREAVDLVRSSTPDLLLLDIEMPDMDGFDVVDAVAKLVGAGVPVPLVAFVTAHRKLAPQAFKTGAIDFLPKPVRLGRLETTLSRAHQAIEGRQATRRLVELEAMLGALRVGHPPARDAHVWVPRRGEVVRIDLDLTDHIVAEGAYVRLHVDGNSYLHRSPIGEIETLLDPARFLRVHRSHIVRADHVCAIRRTIHDAGEFVLRNGQRVPLGRKYSRDARRRLTRTGLPDRSGAVVGQRPVRS